MKCFNAKVRYLLALYEVNAKKEVIRSADIARNIGLARSSVHNMMKTFSEEGIVVQDYYKEIQMTEYGQQLTKETYQNFRLIFCFYKQFLKLSREQAREDAIIFISTMSQESIDQLVSMVRKAKKKA